MFNILQSDPEMKAGRRPSSANSAAIEKSRMVAWLADKVGRSQSEIITETVSLTPVLAELLLATNEANRKVSDTFVENYRRDIAADRWLFNGEPVVVAKDGSLNDGQHRCLAVIAAGRAINVVMVFGVSRESRFTVDQGRIRTAGDYLGMNGHVDANVLAAVSCFIWQWKEKNRLSVSPGDRPTKSEILSVADHYRDIHDSILIAGRGGVAAVGGKSVIAFCHWAISRKSHVTDATDFVRQLIDGNDLSKRHPILTARNRLSGNQRLNANEKVELIFRAWNAQRRGERPVSLQALNGQLPKLVGR